MPEKKKGYPDVVAGDQEPGQLAGHHVGFLRPRPEVESEGAAFWGAVDPRHHRLEIVAGVGRKFHTRGVPGSRYV